MINLKANTVDPTPLDDAIVAVFERMKDLPIESDDYSKATDQLIKLYKLRDESTARTRVSPDALVQVAGSLTGILAILTYERTGIVLSKALGFVMKAAR